MTAKIAQKHVLHKKSDGVCLVRSKCKRSGHKARVRQRTGNNSFCCRIPMSDTSLIHIKKKKGIHEQRVMMLIDTTSYKTEHPACSLNSNMHVTCYMIYAYVLLVAPTVNFTLNPNISCHHIKTICKQKEPEICRSDKPRQSTPQQISTAYFNSSTKQPSS